MNANSTYRDSMLLMAGVLSVVILGGVLLIGLTDELSEERPTTLSDLEPCNALRLLMVREYGRVAEEWRLAPDVAIAIGSGFSGPAAEVLQRFGRPWIPAQSWEDNQGVPPPGTVLIKDLRIDGDSGFVAIVVGEVAGNLACGYDIESRYSWRGHWGSPDESSIRMC